MGTVDSLLTLVGLILLAWGAINGVVWLLGSVLANPSSDPIFLLDQRLRQKLLSQSCVWIASGAVLAIGGPHLWSYVTRGNERRDQGQPSSRAIGLAPLAIGVGCLLALSGAALEFVPLPQRTITFSDGEFGPATSVAGGQIRVSARLEATSGEILSGDFRETYEDANSGQVVGPIALSSSVSVISSSYDMPSTIRWAFLVPQDGAYAVVVGVCSMSMNCSSIHMAVVSGHVTATGYPPYSPADLLLLTSGMAVAVPPIVYWRIKFGGKAGQKDS